MDARWQCELAGKVSTRMNNTSNAALIAIVVIFDYIKWGSVSPLIPAVDRPL